MLNKLVELINLIRNIYHEFRCFGGHDSTFGIMVYEIITILGPFLAIHGRLSDFKTGIEVIGEKEQNSLLSFLSTLRF